MYLEYSHSKEGNFGDDLNPWIFPKLIPQCFSENENIAFLGIGTILDQTRVKRSELDKTQANIVFSSGAGFGVPPKMDKRWHIYCVRGQHTAKKLGLSTDKVIVDGAYLLRTMQLPQVNKKFPLAFMPHHSSEDFVDWKSICKQAGILFISAKQPVDSVLKQMLSAEMIITEAMHGAIVADALRIPWIPVSFSPKFMPEKWHDFSQAVGLNLQISSLPFCAQIPLKFGKAIEHRSKRGLNKLGIGPQKWQRLPNAYKAASAMQLDQLGERIISIGKSVPPSLSTDAVVERLTDKLSTCLQQVKNDHQSGIFCQR